MQSFYKAATSGKDFSKFIAKYLEHKKKKKEEAQKEEPSKESQNQVHERNAKRPTIIQKEGQSAQVAMQEAQAPAKFEKQITITNTNTTSTSNQPDNKTAKNPANTGTNANSNANTNALTTNTSAGVLSNKQQNEKPKLVRPESAMKRPEKINSEIKEVKEDPNKNNKKVI
jgi:hypothetical protein